MATTIFDLDHFILSLRKYILLFLKSWIPKYNFSKKKSCEWRFLKQFFFIFNCSDSRQINWFFIYSKCGKSKEFTADFLFLSYL